MQVPRSTAASALGVIVALVSLPLACDADEKSWREMKSFLSEIFAERR